MSLKAVNFQINVRTSNIIMFFSTFGKRSVFGVMSNNDDNIFIKYIANKMCVTMTHT